ncbi:hypothetical protein AJ79_01369 [Helicocarpus griseus UAMH5409]|uniref:Peptidase S1 domain-containing protein n=1 Tax=Helicocarpus griseus UAMH5409 TaxID=1447875 RepID=A0A2B7Y6Y3_9EURO|nr:hypothetical protein AJ79_01369 [Helicocarpus griseus UAMH5409]
MGLSCSLPSGVANGTLLGGVVSEKNNCICASGKQAILGMTCYHVVRYDANGNIDPDIQANGAINLTWPFQSPSKDDIKAAEDLARTQISSLRSADPTIASLMVKRQQLGQQRLQEVTDFDPMIGQVVAVSWLRNVPLSTDTSKMAIMDWALVEVTNSRMSVNYIGTIVDGLESQDAKLAWHPVAPSTIKVTSLPTTNSYVFKRGRSTGVTAGILGRFAPASMRISSSPTGLHHRALIVNISPTDGRAFAAAGDSGAWCLNGKGHVVGLVIGGDETDGTALILPMELVFDDMEQLTGWPRGSLELA